MFWVEAHRLFRGLLVFQKYGIVHHDIKPQNLVYNTIDNRINFIDFGHMRNIKNELEKCDRSDNWIYDYPFWNYPFEIQFLNRGEYNYFVNKSEKEKERFVIDFIEDLKKDLANPKLVEMLKQYRVEAFLTEEGKVLNQLITGDIPNDLQKFLVKVRDIRNNYYLTISGKAVTGGEALRNYGTVPQPGDDSREMINKLDGMAGRVNQTIQLKRQLFGLPELNLAPGMKTNLKPNDDYSINSQTTYEINKVYTDSNGNKAKYLGNDEWEDI
jgi:serine/threonine protein kinase